RLVVGAVTERPARGLQRVLIAVDLIAVVAEAELRQVGEHAIGRRGDEGLGELVDERIVLGRAVLHPVIADLPFLGDAIGHGILSYPRACASAFLGGVEAHLNIHEQLGSLTTKKVAAGPITRLPAEQQLLAPTRPAAAGRARS